MDMKKHLIFTGLALAFGLISCTKEEKDIVESHQLGVNSYVVKPVDFKNFSKTIAELGFYWLMINNEPQL